MRPSSGFLSQSSRLSRVLEFRAKMPQIEFESDLSMPGKGTLLNRCPMDSRVTPTDTITIAGIPANSNTILGLFKHFKKYGRIRGIYSFGTTATIQYDSLESAQRAFQSPYTYTGNCHLKCKYARRRQKAQSSLSQAVNWVKVRSVLNEVTRELASAQEETSTLQGSMHRSCDQPQALKQTEANWNALLESYQTQRTEQIQEVEALVAERETAEPARILEIDEKLGEIEELLAETSDSIAHIEASIAELDAQ
jgi:chromosome segregation ATPase